MRTWTLCAAIGALLFAAACEVGPEAGTYADLAKKVETVTVELPAFVESEHPYANDQDREWWIEAPDFAQMILLPFDRLDLEWGYDYLRIYDGDGNLIETLTGQLDGSTYQVPGHRARLRLTSDGSVRRFGVLLSRYQFVRTVADYTDHRPVCREIGSYGEGWYWADTGALVVSDRCAALPEAGCVAIGSRSEGWVSGDTLITWDSQCHRLLRLALWGEPCGPSIGLSCFDDLYCQGLPENTLGGSGTCLDVGSCETDADCSAEGNDYPVPACLGHAVCEEGQCGWVCDGAPVAQWGWVSHLVRDLESEHPYTNHTDRTWSQQFPGASKFKLFFQQIEIEAGYDHLSMWGVEELAMALPDRAEQFWSPEFVGDTAYVHLDSDYSITGYGFGVSMVSFYAPIPDGSCTEDTHCAAAERCEPNNCFNPYAPCYGRCVPREGGAGMGEPCGNGLACQTGLFCKNVLEDGLGRCEPELWCESETVEADCSKVVHPAVPGVWTCLGHSCDYQTTVPVQDRFASVERQAIPDSDPAGITSVLFVDRLPACLLWLTVDVDIGHTYRGDLVVGLTEPGGERVILHDRAGASADDLHIAGFEFPIPFTKEGDFVLDVSDHAAWDTGALEGWALQFHCRD